MSKTSSKRRRKFFFILGTFFLLLFLLHVSGVDAKGPDFVRALTSKLSLTPAKKSEALPVDVQKAIIAKAQKELIQGSDPKHFDVKAKIDFEDIEAAKANILPDNPLYIFKRFGRGLGVFFTFDPLAKTQLILKNNSQETVETLILLQKSLNEKNPIIRNYQIGVVAGEIVRIEGRFNQILNIQSDLSKTDKSKARAVQGIAFNYAEKYFRSELILKVLEDRLDDASMIKLEKARLKGLGVFGKILVGYHPDPQVLSKELAKSLAKVSGINYTELKTAEILQEIEDAASDETQKTSLRLAQYLLIDKFENKVLAMPFFDREELLASYVSQLSGNPMQEFKTLTRIRRVFNSRHLITWTEVYKARVLEKFEERVAGLTTADLQNQFVNSWVNDPADLRILEALELRTQGGMESGPKPSEIVKTLKNISYERIAQAYKDNPGKLKNSLFYKSATAYPDVLDIKVAIGLGKTFDNGPIKDLEKQIVEKFAVNLPKSLSGISTNPLPQTISLFSEIKTDVPVSSQNEVKAAINAEIRLDSIEVPATNTAVENLVGELESSQEIAAETQVLSVSLGEIISRIDNSSPQPTQQEVLEQAQVLAVEIISAPAGVETPVEESLPTNIQQEIEQVQGVANPTPQIDTTLVETVVNTVEQTVQSTPIPTSAPETVSPPATVTVPVSTPSPVPIETPPPETISVTSL